MYHIREICRLELRGGGTRRGRGGKGGRGGRGGRGERGQKILEYSQYRSFTFTLSSDNFSLE